MAKSRNFLSLFWANAQEGKGHLENEVSLFMLSRFCLLWSALAEQASSVGGSRRQHDIIMEERKRRKLSLSRQVGSVPYSITGPYIRSVVCCRQSWLGPGWLPCLPTELGTKGWPHRGCTERTWNDVRKWWKTQSMRRNLVFLAKKKRPGMK